MLKNMTVQELSERMKRADGKTIVLDVREPVEIATAALPGTLNIPMREIPERLNEVPPNKEIAVLCHHGNRSGVIGDYLLRNGFTNVYNVAGGIAAWSREVDPSTPTY